ncbi:MAG: peptidylprolyl isomerase [Bacteroidales bacterium]|nr:peptidylprolyl isomerase [Bacteroidales bacterium]
MNRTVRFIIIMIMQLLLFACQAPAGNEKTMVSVQTTLGEIKLVLYDETPLHRDNFIRLVKSGYFDGISFHRVIRDFMIQAGDPSTKTGQAEPLPDSMRTFTIPAEFRKEFFHKKGALAAARQGNNVNPEMRSSGTQFYIVQGIRYGQEELAAAEKQIDANIKQSAYTRIFNRIADSLRIAGTDMPQGEMLELANSRMFSYLSSSGDFKFSDEQISQYQSIGGVPRLDGTYTVFGEVIEGFDIVDRIAGVPTSETDRPLTDVKIIKMKIVTK